MTAPDWSVAIIDGQPVQTVNAAAVALLVEKSPLGVAEAMRRLETAMPAWAFAHIKKLVAK